MRGREKEPHIHKLTPKNPGKNDKYLNIILCNSEGQFTKSIHKLVAEHFVSGYFEGAVVNHIDGDNRNNDSSNLEWVSQLDNVHKSYETSGLNQTRNYMWWKLYDRNENLIGVFKGHKDMSKFIEEFGIDTSTSSLVKYGVSNGYRVEKLSKYDM